MKYKTGWFVVIALGLVILLFLPSLLIGRSSMGGYGGMMGPGMMDSFRYLNPLGFFGMALMWLIPAGLLVLLVIGAVALVNGLTRSGSPASSVPDRKCSNCGKSTQVDWATCPYCGKSL
jgi:hypothetical protein